MSCNVTIKSQHMQFALKLMWLFYTYILYVYSEDAVLSEVDNDKGLSDWQIGSSRQVLFVHLCI